MTEHTGAPYYITAHELAVLGDIPREMLTSENLIYNSPAALDFNSPGAEGFGVKRAGLAIPGSIMLLISPACCGRNTSALRGTENFGERFGYLLLDATDIVTGKHLSKIPEAVAAFVKSRATAPTAVMLCITCVDALLGTDMERVCQKAQARVNLPVLPCYMYALTRESSHPPMTAVRKTVYSLLTKKKKRGTVANLLGFFSPLAEESELFSLLESIGIRRVQQLGACQTYAEYEELAAANFNLVLNPEAREAAEFFRKELKIPYIELTRLYQLDKIDRQYKSLAAVLSHSFPIPKQRDEAEAAAEGFLRHHTEEQIAVGSRINGNSFELALALTRYGVRVSEIYATPQTSDFPFIKKLGELSPDIKIYTNISPRMFYYEPVESNVTLAIGQDACYYHPTAHHVLWHGETQPFGYQGVRDLFRAMKEAVK